jgi:hypothetical protein
MPETPARPDLRTGPRHASARAASDPAPAGLELGYQPIWNRPQQAISLHCAEPALPDGSGASRPQDDIDRQVLSRVLDDVAAGGCRGAGSICVPVHFASLATAAPRAEQLRACERIPAGLSDLLVWEIIGLPETVGETTLFSVVSAIRPYGRAIFLRQALETPQFDAAAAVGIHSVGTDLRDAAGSESELLRRLHRFAERAHALGLRCHAHGLATRSLSLTALGAGFDYLAGPAIAGRSARPRGPLPYDVESLLLHPFAAAAAPGARR